MGTLGKPQGIVNGLGIQSKQRDFMLMAELT